MKRSVLKQVRRENPFVTCEPAVGVDYGAIRMAPGEDLVSAVCPVTRTRTRIAASGVLEALNNVACSGARPVGVMVSVLMPTQAGEQELRALMKEVDQAAAWAGVSVLGGHTEITRRVREPLLTVVGYGIVKSGKRIGAGGLRPGMELVVSKTVGLQGTAILAREKEQELRSRFAQPFLDQAAAFDDPEKLSVLREAAALTDHDAEERPGECRAALLPGTTALSGRRAYLHDLSEGGIFGALWELGQSSGVGLEVELKKIPIRQETVEICEFFDINPYKLISGGSLLMAATNGTEAVRRMAAVGVEATVIGRITEGNDRVVLNGEERRFLETTQTDELYKVIYD